MNVCTLPYLCGRTLAQTERLRPSRHSRDPLRHGRYPPRHGRYPPRLSRESGNPVDAIGWRVQALDSRFRGKDAGGVAGMTQEESRERRKGSAA